MTCQGVRGMGVVYRRQEAELRYEARTNSLPQILPPFLYTAYWYTVSEEEINSFNQSQIWRIPSLPPDWTNA